MRGDAMVLSFLSTVASGFIFLFAVWLLVHYTLFKNTIRRKWFYSFLTGFILLLWFSLVVVLGSRGFFAKNPLFAPWIVIGFLVLFEGLRRVYHSRGVLGVVALMPMHWLIGIQFYRIAGVVFLTLYRQDVLPAVFAFSAGYGDIFVGLTAPIVAWWYYYKKPYARQAAILWNIIGIIDLVVALSVGFLGFSKPVQFLPLQPSTEALSLFPLVMIPLFAVPLALLMHFLGLRVLKKR